VRKARAPDSVIGCDQQAIAERDLGALGALLAPDFECSYVDYPDTRCGDCAEALEALEKLFAAPPEKLRRFDVTFGADYSVAPGGDPIPE
jgi:hypothetical protein